MTDKASEVLFADILSQHSSADASIILGDLKKAGLILREEHPRFFISHGVIHDRVTGKHVVTDGEPPFEDSVEQVCDLLNSLVVAPPRS